MSARSFFPSELRSFSLHDTSDGLVLPQVRFFCSPESQAYLSAILEPATCRYVLKFHTPLLCKHP